MAELTTRLALPKASKGVVDPGTLFSEGEAIAGAANQVLGAAVQVKGAVDTAKQKKAVAARQAASDIMQKEKHDLAIEAGARAARAESRDIDKDHRAITTFNNTQAEVKLKENTAKMEDDAIAGFKNISRAETAFQQGHISRQAKDLAVDVEMAYMERNWPEMEAEYAAFAQKHGVDHYLFRGIQESKLERANELNRIKTSKDTMAAEATTAGLVHPDTPPEDAVRMGQNLLFVREQVAEEKRLADEESATIDEGRKVTAEQEKNLENTRIKLGFNASMMYSGSIINQFKHSAAAISTEEEWKELAANAPLIFATLKTARHDAYSLTGGNTTAMQSVDRVFDQSEEFLKGVLSGDYSYVQKVANELKLVEDRLGIRDAETLAFLAKWDYKVFGPLTDTVGISLMQDEELVKGMLDDVQGHMHSTRAAFARQVTEGTEEVRTGVTTLDTVSNSGRFSEKEAKAIYKTTNIMHEQAKKFILEGNEKEREWAAESFANSHAQFAVAATRLSDTKRDNIKSHVKAAEILFDTGSVVAIEKLIGDPETKQRGEDLMTVTRSTAHKMLNNMKSTASDGPLGMVEDFWSFSYDENQGLYTASYDRAGAEAHFKASPRARTEMGVTGFDNDAEYGAEMHPSLKAKLETMNSTLDFLDSTKVHDPQVGRASGLDYRKALATGDFSGVAKADNPKSSEKPFKAEGPDSSSKKPAGKVDHASVTEKLEKHLVSYEGYKSKAYQDEGGVWTIGFGRTDNEDGTPVKEGDTTTKEAEKTWKQGRMAKEVRSVEAEMEQWGYDDLTEGQLIALASFRFNGGRGMLSKLTRNGERDIETVGEKLALYTHAGDAGESEGLLKRRLKEQEIFKGMSKDAQP